MIRGHRRKGPFHGACDIQDRMQVDSLISRAKNELGRLDILVNNAGLLLPGTIEETTDEIIDSTLNINVKGILYAIRAATPIMKDQKYGRIVNVSSITGKNGDNSTVFVYGASKGAVISLTRSVARQLGPFGVTCNAIAPHAVMTEMMKYWTDEKKAKAAACHPRAQAWHRGGHCAPHLFSGLRRCFIHQRRDSQHQRRILHGLRSSLTGSGRLDGLPRAASCRARVGKTTYSRIRPLSDFHLSHSEIGFGGGRESIVSGSRRWCGQRMTMRCA